MTRYALLLVYLQTLMSVGGAAGVAATTRRPPRVMVAATMLVTWDPTCCNLTPPPAISASSVRHRCVIGGGKPKKERALTFFGVVIWSENDHAGHRFGKTDQNNVGGGGYLASERDVWAAATGTLPPLLVRCEPARPVHLPHGWLRQLQYLRVHA
jgi:hypothetical protein